MVLEVVFDLLDAVVEFAHVLTNLGKTSRIRCLPVDLEACCCTLIERPIKANLYGRLATNRYDSCFCDSIWRRLLAFKAEVVLIKTIR